MNTSYLYPKMLKDKFKPDKFKLALSLAQLSPSLFLIQLSINNIKRLLEMSSVAENNRIPPAIDKLDNKLVSVTDDNPL